MKFFIPTPVPLPPRPNEIHDRPCKDCPSTKSLEEDWEMQDMLCQPLQVRADHAFRCAWRPEKLCRGYCDAMGLDAACFDKDHP